MSTPSIDPDRIERVAVALGLAMKQGNSDPYSLAVALEVAGLLAAPPVTGLAAAVDAMGALPMPTGAPGPSPWERAVSGLNALADAQIAFWIEPDGHISNPFGDEHIEWDDAAARWRLVHDDEDDVHPPHPALCRVPSSPDCTCPPVESPEAEALAAVDRSIATQFPAVTAFLAEDPHTS
jgi:hypothetical protein